MVQSHETVVEDVMQEPGVVSETAEDVVLVPKAVLEIPQKASPRCEPREGAHPTSHSLMAQEAFQKGHFEQAIACSQVALEKDWNSVPAMHIEGASFAALGKWDHAKDSFAGALALDPNDPETLAAVSEFYLNMLLPKKRRTIKMGLEYAKRGIAFAKLKESVDERLLDRLELLVAEAYNDLGEAEKAREKSRRVVLRRPRWPSALHELAMSSFGLSDLKAAENEFERVLKTDPLHGYAAHFLAIIKERNGKSVEALALYEKANSIEPEVFSKPYSVDRTDFENEVESALKELPKKYIEQLPYVEVRAVDYPDIDDLLGNGTPLSPTILGLFRGDALNEDSMGQTIQNSIPTKNELDDAPTAKASKRSILIYRFNLCRVSKDRDELNQRIRRTIAHEWGHLNGLTESELARIEGHR